MKSIFLFISITIMICTSCKTDKSPTIANSDSSKDIPTSISTQLPNSSRQSPTDTILVSSMEELVQKAKSNRVLVLRNIDYSLDKDLVYYITNDETKIIDKKVVETQSLGGQLYISGLNNFQIIGNEDTELISENELAPPLYIVKSNDIQIKNIKFRYSDNVKSKLKVPLSFISNSTNLELSNCQFEGKGTYGVQLNAVKNFIFVGGAISKCTQGIINIVNSQFVSFDSCIMNNNRCAYSAINVKGLDNSVSFSNVTLAYNVGLNKNEPKSNFFNVGLNSVSMDACTLKGNNNFKSIGLSLDQLKKCELSGMDI